MDVAKEEAEEQYIKSPEKIKVLQNLKARL